MGDELGWVLREESESVAPPGAPPTPIDVVRLGRVLEAVRDGVVVVDRDRCVAFANRAAQAMFAPHPVTVGESVPDPWKVSVRRLVEELFEHEALNAEAVVEPEQGLAYWLRAYLSGAGDTAVLIVSDITAEERREQAQRDFVAHAAHELQSPLAAISGAVEVLLAGAHEEEEPRLRFLGHIARENERLSRLLDSLLLLAQAQAGGSEVGRVAFPLRPLLEEVAARAPDATRVDVVCPAGLRAEAHRSLVESALANLVANALRHGGGGRVVASGRRGTDGTVKVEVTDFGGGLSADARGRAFDRFYRAGRTGEGFGLGLSIARQAALAVGGDVELRANPLGGTIAVLTLPAPS